MAKKQTRQPKTGQGHRGKAKMMPAQVEEATSSTSERGPRKVLILDRPDGSGYTVMLDVPSMKQYTMQVPADVGAKMMLEVFRIVVKYGVEHGSPIATAGVMGGRKY